MLLHADVVAHVFDPHAQVVVLGLEVVQLLLCVEELVVQCGVCLEAEDFLVELGDLIFELPVRALELVQLHRQGVVRGFC